MFGAGPVVYWRPFEGLRHALSPAELPRAGQVRDTLCGVSATLTDPSEVDWLAPTCDHCMVHAKARRDRGN